MFEGENFLLSLHDVLNGLAEKMAVVRCRKRLTLLTQEPIRIRAKPIRVPQGTDVGHGRNGGEHRPAAPTIQGSGWALSKLRGFWVDAD